MREITLIKAMNEALREEMLRDDTVFIMGEDVRLSVYGAERGLVAEFGEERVRNTPISEQGFVGAAIGASATGMRPVVNMMVGNFMYTGMDQLSNNLAKLRYMSGGQFTFPLVIITAFGAVGGVAAQHSDTPYPVFMNVGGIKMVCPTTPYEAKGLLKSAIRSNNPVMFFQHGALGGVRGHVPEEEYLLPLDQADVKRDGSDVTIVGIGLMVHRSLAAAKTLEAEGISAEVIDLRSLVPIDKEKLLSSVRKTGRLVVVDEARLRCSAASEVAALVAEEGRRRGASL